MADDVEKPPEKENHSFPPGMRLRKGPEFQAVFSQRVSVSDKTLVLYAMPNGLNHCRIGLSVSKKVTRSAPGRNRWKRVLREAFRLDQHLYPSGLDLVILVRIPKPEGLKVVRQDLFRLVERVVKRLNATRKKTPTAPSENAPKAPDS